MNDLFVNVKVDREERPDLDSVYMDAVVTLTGHGGWPMTVFLTPEGEPFFGGTYYPPEPRHGLPSFRQVLSAVADAYRERRADVARSARELVEARPPLERAAAVARAAPAVAARRRGARAARASSTRSGAGSGARRSSRPPPALEFLLRRDELRHGARRRSTRWPPAGMYDLVGGGFHRYSVDEQWLVPHFEKMLYDNALLAPVYLHAWVVTGDERYREVAERTLEYMLRELALPEGGFASAQDADTDGVEGLTFTLDAGGARGGAARRAPISCSRSSTAASSCAAS